MTELAPQVRHRMRAWRPGSLRADTPAWLQACARQTHASRFDMSQVT